VRYPLPAAPPEEARARTHDGDGRPLHNSASPLRHARTPLAASQARTGSARRKRPSTASRHGSTSSAGPVDESQRAAAAEAAYRSASQHLDNRTVSSAAAVVISLLRPVAMKPSQPLRSQQRGRSSNASSLSTSVVGGGVGAGATPAKKKKKKLRKHAHGPSLENDCTL
jgi:hypothetical protein